MFTGTCFIHIETAKFMQVVSYDTLLVAVVSQTFPPPLFSVEDPEPVKDDLSTVTSSSYPLFSERIIIIIHNSRNLATAFTFSTIFGRFLFFFLVVTLQCNFSLILSWQYSDQMF